MSQVVTVWDRVHEALQDPRFVWRSAKRLAVLAGHLSEDDLIEAIRNRSEVVFGLSRDGEALVRLASRAPKS